MPHSSAHRTLILATGGTIAGAAASPLADRYVAGVGGAAALHAAADALGTGAMLDVVEVSAVGSQDIDGAIWARLVAAIEAAIAEGRHAGVVVAHGTDTLEETAFLLDLVLASSLPIVVTGAMRPPNAIGADGPRNLAGAIRVAGDPAAHGRGVLVVIGDEIHAARAVRKAQTGGADAFRSAPGGPLGSVSPAGPHFFAPATASARAPLALPPAGGLPPVAILYCHAAMDLGVVDAVIGSGVAGIVIAGVGGGNAPRAVLDRLAGAVGRGVAVVRSTRIDGGTVTSEGEVDDASFGFVAGGSLGPQKARILLQLLLAAGTDAPDALRPHFAVG
jgi:L-asparaginase